MDTTPIVARLSAIANSVNALKQLQSLSLEEFISDHIVYTSAERDFQVAIQATLDIGSILLAASSSNVPENYADVFVRLAEIGALPRELAMQLVNMAKFRNVLVHMYLEVRPESVYDYLQHNLSDFDLFAQYASEYLAKLK